MAAKEKHQRIEEEIERNMAVRHIHSNQPANEHRGEKREKEL